MADRHGPIRTGRFNVEIEEVEVPGWQSVTIPSSSTEMGEYSEGEGDYDEQLWVRTTFQDLHMERGVQPGDTRMVDWRNELRDGNVDDGQKEVAVILQDEEGENLIRWEFHDAWIKYYNPPDLNAAADGEVATEEITLGFDEIERLEQ